MDDYDKSAHDMMRFRAGKYAEFERGRFLVAYHEDRLYSVRDEKRGTVTLVEARDPESAYLKASSIRPISTADVVARDCYDRILAENDTMRNQLAKVGKKVGDSMDDVRPVVQRDAGKQALNKYFSIGDSYTYELSRVKEAFYVGTMTLDDFEEWNEDNVSDLCDYLMKELFRPNCGAEMEPDEDGQRGEKNRG